MGFFQGVAKAYGEISDKKEREGVRKEEREARKTERTEDWAQQERMANLGAQLARDNATFTAKMSSLRGDPKDASAVAEAITGLKNLGLSPDSITALENTQNPKGIIAAYNSATDSFIKAGESGVSRVEFAEMLNAHYETVEIIPGELGSFKFKGEEYPTVVSGSAGIPPLVTRENLDVNEVEKVEERILTENLNSLTREQSKISTALTKLLEQEANGKWSANPDYFEAVQESLMNRQLELEKAADQYKERDYSGVLQLFGKGPVERVLKAQGGRNQINPVFLDESIPEVVEPWSYQGEGSEYINNVLKNLGAL